MCVVLGYGRRVVQPKLHVHLAKYGDIGTFWVEKGYRYFLGGPDLHNNFMYLLFQKHWFVSNSKKLTKLTCVRDLPRGRSGELQIDTQVLNGDYTGDRAGSRLSGFLSAEPSDTCTFEHWNSPVFLNLVPTGQTNAHQAY